MKTGFDFIQRMQQDAEFRRQVHACLQSEERLAFLRKEGYDFTPFIQIINQLASWQRSIGEFPQTDGSAAPRKSRSGFLARINQIFRAANPPRPDR
jgi:predicted ribosomally synthesized peptide with nif11-like leader